MADSQTFFANRECAHFPCHENADPDCFNCLFCYCPLYALGDQCGGNYRYTENGIKDCMSCLLPHAPGGYAYIQERLPLLIAQVQKRP